MKKIANHIAAFIPMFAMISSLAVAGGYQINEHGARATGMGGAFAAQASDGSAMFFNAAGLGFQQGFNVLVGTTLIFPSTSFTGPGSSTTKTDMESQVFYPSNLYASYAIDEQLVVGLGVFNPYGLGTEWAETWSGRYHAVKTDLQTFYINPTVAYKINDQLAVGVGASYVIGTVLLEKNIPLRAIPGFPPTTPDGKSKLEGDGSGINFNAGILWKATEELSVGVSYRHLTEIEFEGDATFTNIPAAAQGSFPSGVTGKATLPMPSNIMAGVAYKINESITVEGDFQYVGWKEYKELKVEFNKAVGGQTTQTSAKDWNDGTLVRIGGEYKLNEQLALRLGYIRDMTPQPEKSVEPMLPDADRNDITVGGSYKINENLAVDASFMMVLFEDRDSKFSSPSLGDFFGTYKSSASLVSLNIGYSF